MTSTRSLLLVLAIALGCVLIPAGTASASDGALRVLIAYSDGAHTEQALTNEIAAQPGVATVDTLDAGSTTPSLTTIRSYDVVLTFSNTDYANSTMLGNELATYADEGGVVMEFDLNWFNRAEKQLGGRWASGGYSAYQAPASTVVDAGVTLGPHEASSPLLAGVTALGAGTHQDLAVAPHAVEVAKWTDGHSAIAFKGHAIGVNTCVADGCSGFSGDYGRLVLNAAKTRVVGQLSAPNFKCSQITFFQTGAAAGNSYTLPQGVVTSWYVQDGVPQASGATLRVARRTTPDTVTLLGEAASGARSAGQVNGPFPARIPVSGGDLIGLGSTGDGNCVTLTAVAGDTWVGATGDLSTAGPSPVAAGPIPGKFPIEAIVEPDGDNDGFGDLTQDRCVDAPGSANGCRSADLSVTVTASTATVPLGRDVAYTVTARNDGPDPAPDVVLTNTLPQEAPTSTSLGTLASGQTGSVQFAAKRSGTGPATDTATIASGADDPDAGNNSASATTTVIGPAVVSQLTQTHRRWRLGTTFKFRLDKAAPVTLLFTRRGVTRRTLIRAGQAGLNKVHFTRALSRTRRLKPGTYNVTVTATTPGVGSTSKVLRFTILR